MSGNLFRSRRSLMELRTDSLTSLNKNAISSFMEYGQARGKVVQLVETSSGLIRQPGCRFCFAAEVDGEEIAHGYGGNKKDAKLQAAERAIRALYGTGSNRQADTGRNRSPLNRSTDSSDDSDDSSPLAGKDPVSGFMEYAQSKRLQPRFDYLDKEGPSHCPTFTVQAYLNERAFPEGRSNNKKEAKKKAAIKALKELVREGSIEPTTTAAKTSSNGGGSEFGSEFDDLCPGQNPVSVINEFAQKQGYSIEIKELRTSGLPHRPSFEVAVVLDGRQFPSARSENKKKGKQTAALLALRELKNQGLYSASISNTSSSQTLSQTVAANTFEDKMAALCHQKFDEVVASLPDNLAGRKVLAGIVMQDEIIQSFQVISLASGNRCITGNALTVDGTVLHDSHAEIIARRGLCRFLFDELLKSFQGKKNHIIVHKGQQTSIRPGISFHLYISTAPCGDGGLFTHSDPGSGENVAANSHRPIFSSEKQGQLRTKVEKGEGTIPLEDDIARQTLDGIRRGERLRTMSCSDKICKWNTLGLQGALLSNFLNSPLYLSSITLGDLYNQGHLARAVCCRVDRLLIKTLPEGFCVNHPQLGAVTACTIQRSIDKSRPVSVNWNLSDNSVEITDGTTGQIHKDEPTVKGKHIAPFRSLFVDVRQRKKHSRLCKKEMFERYKQLTMEASNKDYYTVKKSSQTYQNAKQILKKHLLLCGYGAWLSKPAECDKFL